MKWAYPILHAVSDRSRLVPQSEPRKCPSSCSVSRGFTDGDTRIHGLCWGMEEKEQRQRCWRCDGTLWPQTAIDLHHGVAVQLLVCRSCSRRWYPGDRPRLAIGV
jgi:hypothetical protein